MNIRLLLVLLVLIPLKIMGVGNSYAENFVVPISNVNIIWQGDKLKKLNSHNFQVTPMEFRNRIALLEVIKNELQKYPAHMLKGKLKNIYLIKNITMNGVRVSGVATSGSGSIFLGRVGLSRMKLNFHHEMAHFLYYQFNFPKYKEWLSINPPNFRYLGSGIHAIQQRRSQGSSGSKNFSRGFITNYALSAIEEDFAELTVSAIKGGEAFTDRIASFKKLRQKLKLIKDFYSSIDTKLAQLF